jgi:uncharacterized protein (DUF305 family)
MQINIDKKTGVFLAVIAVLIAVIVGQDTSNNRIDMGMHRGSDHSNHSMEMNQDNEGKTGYTGADIMFLQMMIPHHQQAIDISNLALKTTKDSELISLARTIIKAQSAEILQMKAWLKDANASTEVPHAMGHGMGGMLDDAELSALQAATGKEFDLLWLKGMIAHHDGAIHMTEMVRDADKAEIKTFGENIVKDQSAQIKQMQAMLKRINS